MYHPHEKYNIILRLNDPSMEVRAKVQGLRMTHGFAKM
jgi:hypothetical protein